MTDEIIKFKWFKVWEGVIFNWKIDKQILPGDQLYPLNEIAKSKLKYLQ